LTHRVKGPNHHLRKRGSSHVTQQVPGSAGLCRSFWHVSNRLKYLRVCGRLVLTQTFGIGELIVAIRFLTGGRPGPYLDHGGSAALEVPLAVALGRFRPPFARRVGANPQGPTYVAFPLDSGRSRVPQKLEKQPGACELGPQLALELQQRLHPSRWPGRSACRRVSPQVCAPRRPQFFSPLLKNERRSGHPCRGLRKPPTGQCSLERSNEQLRLAAGLDLYLGRLALHSEVAPSVDEPLV